MREACVFTITCKAFCMAGLSLLYDSSPPHFQTLFFFLFFSCFADVLVFRVVLLLRVFSICFTAALQGRFSVCRNGPAAVACGADQDDPIEEDEEPHSSHAAQDTRQQSQHRKKQRQQTKVHTRSQACVYILVCLQKQCFVEACSAFWISHAAESLL